ncbi:MAG: YceI family protein [Myxococcales bacterium]
MRSMYLMAVVGALCLGGLTAGASTAEAQAKKFKVEPAASQIQFVSDAPLEKFTGTLSNPTGHLTVDPNKPSDAKGSVKVEIHTIKTGIELRDEHVQNESWLDAKKFPHADFVITKVSGIDKLKAGESVEATVTGKFTLHGVTQEVTTKAKVRYTPAEAGKGEALRIVGSFTIKLEDHKVSIPKIVALKVSPDIVVNIDLRAAAE